MRSFSTLVLAANWADVPVSPQKRYLLNILAWSQADVEFITAAEPLAIAQWAICRRPTRLTM